MAGEFCPQCGTARVGSFRFCRGCRFDFDAPEGSATAPPPAQSFTAQYAGTPFGATAAAAPVPSVPAVRSNQAATASGIAWVLFALLIGYLALLQLSYSSLLGDLRLYALWNGIVAAVTLFVATRAFGTPNKGDLLNSAAWGGLNVVGGVLQIGQGVSSEVFLLATVAAGAAMVFALVARADAPEGRGDRAPRLPRPIFYGVVGLLVLLILAGVASLVRS